MVFMARYTRIINCRPCCNLYLILELLFMTGAILHISAFQFGSVLDKGTYITCLLLLTANEPSEHSM